MMERLRHIAPLLASLLMVVLAIETTDLVRCADEAAPVPVTCADGTLKAPPADAAAPASAHHAAAPDCLCHVTFVSTAALPTVGAPGVLAHGYPAYVAVRVEGESSPPGPVPLA